MKQTEILAGLTAFFSISYIIIVNPLILADGGMAPELSVFATIFSSILGCLIMAFFADAPIILTPGMGVNAFFTYTVVLGMHLSWQEALAISFVSGLLFVIIACSPIANLLIQAVPNSLKCAITAGIGLFLVEIGLEKAQLIKAGTNSILALGDLRSPHVLLAIFGMVLSLFFFLKKVKGGFFLAILFTSALGHIWGVGEQQRLVVDFTRLPDYATLLCATDFSHIFTAPFFLSVFSLSMVMVFETMGILEGLLPDGGKFRKAFAGSAFTTVCSSLLGTSPTVAAAESAAGISSGGRTGTMALTAAALFALSLFFVPLLSYVPQAAIAPVIIITGAMMMERLEDMNFRDFTEWFPAFLVVVLIPLTNSISTGLAFGFVAYPLMKLGKGRGKEVHPVGYILGILFLIDLVFQSGLVF